MRKLLRSLGIVTKNERDGISLGLPPWWEISIPPDVSNFFRHLPDLLPNDSVLYFEGTTEKQIRDFLQQTAIANYTKVQVGTIWPRPDIHHISLCRENIDDLVEILDSGITSYPSVHFHAYKDDTVYLSWHDAFCVDPLLVSVEIAEERVAEFCSATDCTYTLVEKV